MHTRHMAGGKKRCRNRGGGSVVIGVAVDNINPHFPEMPAELAPHGKDPVHSGVEDRQSRDSLLLAFPEQQMTRICGDVDGVAPPCQVPRKDQDIVFATGENIGSIRKNDVQKGETGM